MAQGRINVLHLVLSFRRGGRRNAIANLVSRTDGAAARCHLCCVEELGCDPGELRGQFCSVSTLGRRRGEHLGARQRLAEVCRRYEIDLIHAHDASSQYLGALARVTRPRMKLLMTFHRTLGIESARPRDKVRNAVCGLFTQAIVTASQERKRHFLYENRVDAGKLSVIPLGIDLNAFRADPACRSAVRAELGIGPETVLIGAIGHFGPEKGIDQAARAFNELTARYPELDVALAILGEGTPEQRDRIARQAGQRGHSRPVFLPGFQADVRRWFTAFDVLLHAPRMEAFGLVVVEAMACEVPVVGTAVGSIPELVRNEETGIVVQPGSVDALTAALARLVPNREWRQAMGSRARRIAEQEYSIDLCASRYLSKYRDVCGSGCFPFEAIEPADPRAGSYAWAGGPAGGRC